MATLLLIRHGKALNAMEGEYDGLSDIGVQQATRLGASLKALNVDLRRAVSGPRVRQRRTAEETLKAAGVDAQVPVLAELDEHHGHHVVLHAVANPPSPESKLGRELSAASDRRAFARAVGSVLRSWSLGEFAAPVEEDFATFLTRAKRGVDVLRERAVDDAPVVAFTSAGFIGAAVAQAMGGAHALAMELALAVDNASVTELLFSRRDPSRLTLKRFNVVSHLQPDLLTAI